MNDETVIFAGDTIKSLGDGRVGGYLVRFSDASHKDLSGEYFTAKTYYGAREGDGADCLFHHSLPIKGVNSEFTDHIFAPIKTRKDNIGIFAETVLNMSDAYERKVAELVDAGKLGWSSGSAGHACRKAADGEITRWIISEGSLTPTPCESHNVGGVRPLKSVDLSDADALAIKDVMTTTAGYAPPNNREPAPLPPPFQTATGSQNDKNDAPAVRDSGSVECPACHLHCHFDAGHKECPYCGQTLSLSAEGTPLVNPPDGMAGKSLNLTFGEELNSALAAVESCTKRAEGLRQIRVKSDRTLSAATRQKIQDVSEALAKLLASIKPEDLDALNAMARVVDITVIEAQMAVWEAEQSARDAELQAVLMDALSDAS